MNKLWHPLGKIAAGGTVLQVAGDQHGRLWVASLAGLYAGADEDWSPVARLPFTHLSTVFTVGEAVFTAGLAPDGPALLRSIDNGQSWQRCWTDQTTTSISCLAASPNFERDRILLAGTYGDGILRSIDGGRNWKLSNFGLHNFDILALAMAPTWGRREVVFAATDRGIYRSPNGGRAWRQCTSRLDEVIVQALAVDSSGTIYAGTESDGLFCSHDSGTTWRPIPLGTPDVPLINCLYCDTGPDEQESLVVGTGDQGLLRSGDGGQTWEHPGDELPPVLSLGKVGSRLYAALENEGLIYSTDEGRSWLPVEGLAVRRFNWLAPLVSPTGDQGLVAAGPNEGIWLSDDGGSGWEQSAAWSTENVIFHLEAASETALPLLLLSTGNGLYRSQDPQSDWEHVLPLEADREGIVTNFAFSPFLARDGRTWAGGSAGQLWCSSNKGYDWARVATPWGQDPVVALEAAPVDDRPLLLAITVNVQQRVAQLWRSDDNGASWQLWQKWPSTWSTARLWAGGPGGEKVGFGLGPDYFQRTDTGWQQQMIGTTNTPIIAVAGTDGGDRQIVATLSGLYVKDDGEGWRSLDDGLDPVVPADLALYSHPASGRQLLLLTLDGQIWRRAL